MESRQGRSVEVDFFRGVVLIVIVLDHMPGSVLSHLMLHAYALCDSAEVFVFLGGYASAAAYMAVLARSGVQAARARFFKRCWEIYRAYLLTAMLTLLSGAVLALLHLNHPMVDLTGWQPFSIHPVRTAFRIVLLKQQPYLSSVLPMYVIFALFVPLAVPLARRAPAAALAASVGIWWFAPLIATVFSMEDIAHWSFNPFAWQLMFVSGIVGRLHPPTAATLESPAGRWLSRIALAAVVGFAVVRLFVLVQPLPGAMKQHLSFVRVVNFAAIAWLVALFVARGAVARLAQRLPAVVTVGRTGLVCFVGGTLISLIVDTATPHGWHGLAGFLAALAGDFAAIAAMLALAKTWRDWRGPRTRAAVQGARAG